MDVKKTLAAVNAFQNAMERNRTFLAMLQSASQLWEELATINPDELASMVKIRETLDRDIASLTEKRNTLTGAVDSLQSVYDAKFAALEATYEAQKKALETDASMVTANLMAERNNLSAEISAMIASREESLSDLNAQKSKLENDIKGLRASLAQANNALQ